MIKALNVISLKDLAAEIRVCTKCPLHTSRTFAVPGDGQLTGKVMIIGEGPGKEEDLSGHPFVGASGRFLNSVLAGTDINRDDIFITNIVKCRPPGNRVPAPDEVATCTPYLERQLEIIRPRVIVTLGRPSASYMLNNAKMTMGSVRGRWHAWRGIKLMPTFHPSYVLRSYTEETRKAVWSDLKMVMEELGMPVPARGKAM